MFRLRALILLAAQAAAASAFIAPGGPELSLAAAAGAARPTTRLDATAAAAKAENELLHRTLLAARLRYEGLVDDSDDSAPAPVSSAAPTEAAEDFQNLLRTRRTINEFEPTLPPGWEGALIRAVEAATYAPNHKRTEPWRFHLLGAEAIRRVCELNAEIVTAEKGPAAGEKKLDRWLKMPGWLVVTCVRDGESSSEESMDDPTGLARENYAAVCCAAQNLCLSLHAEGLGTKWTTGPVNFDPRFGAAAGLPENEFVVGTMWFGAPVKIPDAPPKKLLIDDVLTRHD